MAERDGSNQDPDRFYTYSTPTSPGKSHDAYDADTVSRISMMAAVIFAGGSSDAATSVTFAEYIEREVQGRVSDEIAEMVRRRDTEASDDE